MATDANNIAITIGVVKDVNEQLSHLLKYAFEDYVSLSNSLGNFYNKLKEFYNESGAFVDKSKLESLLESLNQIIVDLQFHDIIRQKLEHIEQIHAKLLKELENQASDINTTKYAVILPEICKLNVEQLKFISEEYQSHSGSIKHALQKGVGNRVSSLENFVFDFSDTFNHTDSFSDTIGNIINSLKIVGDQVVEARDDNFFDKVLNMKKIYSMRTEREVFNKVFEIIEDVPEEDDDIELF
jgi:hypothetical protein